MDNNYVFTESYYVFTESYYVFTESYYVFTESSIVQNRSILKSWTSRLQERPGLLDFWIRCVRCVRMRSDNIYIVIKSQKINSPENACEHIERIYLHIKSLYFPGFFSQSSLSGPMRFPYPADTTDRWNTKVHLGLWYRQY